MANTNNVNGLQPIRRLDGAKWGNSLRTYYVPAAYGSALYVGDPVVKVTGAASVGGVNAVNLATAGYASGTVGNPITGVVCGFVGTLTAGTTGTPGFFGLSGTPGPLYRPASTSLDWYVLVNDDPEAEFTIQVQGTNTIPVTAVGKSTTLLSGSGSPYTGWSGWTLNSSNTGANQGQVNIIGVSGAIGDNDPTSAYCNFIVRINSHTETNTQPGI